MNDETPKLTVLGKDQDDGQQPPTPMQRAQIAIDVWVRTLSEMTRGNLSHNDLGALRDHVVAAMTDPEAVVAHAEQWPCLDPPFIVGDGG